MRRNLPLVVAGALSCVTVLAACSGEEYGEPEELPVGESHGLRPRNPYATSKAMTDLLAGFYAD